MTDPGCGTEGDRVVSEDDLGLALAFTGADLPRDLEALAALVASRGGTSAITLEGVAPRGWSAALVGGPGCRELATERAIVQPQGARLALVRRQGVAAEKRALADSLLQVGRFAEGRAALQAAVAHEAVVLPDGLLAVGDSYLDEGRFEEALAAFGEVTRQWPASAQGWVGLANAQRHLDRRLEAVAAAGRAAALAPGSLAQIPWLRGDPFVELRSPLTPPAVRMDSPEGPRWRWVSLAEEATDNPQVKAEAGAYAACKEAFRQSSELRQLATARPMPQWQWSPAEESVCTLMWLRAYLAHRSQGRTAVEGLDELADIAQRGLLDERSLYDLALPADLRVPLLLPEARRAQLHAFVAGHRVVPRKDHGWLFP
jgi:tetratricopeptide (TPR) repeat protein